MFTDVSFSRIHWIDSGIHHGSPVVPIAMDEALANSMAAPDAVPVVHLWIQERALFLGRRDARLPRLETALAEMAKEGYSALLRSSGGACVPLDAGVLNVAFLLPGTTLAIDAFFRLASAIIAESLVAYGPVQVGEVVGSYCAGDYDFAIAGKKIGGMAQRRTRHGSILQLCINVEGSGLERGRLMERFYDLAGLADMEKNKPIPYVDAATIGSLSEQNASPVTMPEVKDRLFQAVSSHWPTVPISYPVPKDQVEAAQSHLLDRLGLFSYTSEDIRQPGWRLPATS